MQMPAARKQIGQSRPAHEARQQAVAPRDLLCRRAEQNHRVGGGKAELRAEGEFALARPKLDFERAQRHAERCDAAPDRLQRRVDLIEARFGQILIALIEQLHLRRPRRPGRVFRRKPRVFQLEEMKFDLEPGKEIETLLGKAPQRVAQDLPRRERHRLAVGENRYRRAASRYCGVPSHGSTRNVAGSATMTKSPPPCISAMSKPPPAVNTG